MTIDEAIEVLKHELIWQANLTNPTLKDATKLGIEALKRVKAQRKFKLSYHLKLLPGETEEVLAIQEQSLKRGNEILALGRKMIKETDELLGKPTSPPEGLMPRRVVPPSG